MNSIHDLLTPTNGVAVASAASPFWLNLVFQVSDVAAAVLPILGVTWLLIQMYSHFTREK